MWFQPSYFGALIYAAISPMIFKLSSSQPTEEGRIKYLVALSSIWACVFFILFQSDLKEGPSIFTWIGVQFSILIYAGIMSITALTLVLYIGPIIQLVLTDNPEYEYDLSSLNSYLITPIFEELVYRSCIISGFLVSGWSLFASVFVSAFIFATVPFLELKTAGKEKGNLKTLKIKEVLVKTAYVLFIGFYTGYIFFVTGNLYAVILVRAFTNFMEIPSFSFLNSKDPLYPSRKIIILSYLIGIVGFLSLGYYMLDAKLLNSWHFQLLSHN